MKIRYFAFILFIIAGFGSDYSSAVIFDRSHSPIKSEFYGPQEMLERFLQAVDRGELMVFDQWLDASMIVPVRVEYVYDFTSETSQVKIISTLKTHIPVPFQQDFCVHSVSATLDSAGHITEIEVHISSRE